MECSIKVCNKSDNLHPVMYEGLEIMLCPYHTIMVMSRGMDWTVAEANGTLPEKVYENDYEEMQSVGVN